MKAKGNVVDHEYEIERDGDTVATISKKWFRVRDTYGVAIASGEDTPLILAITVAIDSLTTRDCNRRPRRAPWREEHGREPSGPDDRESCRRRGALRRWFAARANRSGRFPSADPCQAACRSYQA